MADEAAEQPVPSPEPAADFFSDWPAAGYDVSPYRSYHFFQQFRTGQSNPNNFLKGVKWSPDGSCFLTCNDDNTLRVFSLPFNDNGDLDAPSSMPGSDSYGPNVVVSEGESPYDYCWYPYMSASNPDLCVFATSTRDHPIHLWDANSGQLRCTYRAYDAMDEITAAFSIGFNPSGNKIFAGYKKAIRIFEVHHPGREFEQHSTILGNKEGNQVLYLLLLFPQLLLECWPRVPTTRLLQYTEKTIWNCCICCMAKKVGLHKFSFLKTETICILGDGRILIFYAGIFAKLLILSTIEVKFHPCKKDIRRMNCVINHLIYLLIWFDYIDSVKAPIKEYNLILSLLVDILELVVRMVWYIFMIFRLGSGYQAFKEH